MIPGLTIQNSPAQAGSDAASFWQINYRVGLESARQQSDILKLLAQELCSAELYNSQQ